MPDIKSLLDRPSSDIKRPPKFPEGNYRFIITNAVIGTWNKSEGVGVGFEFKATESVEASDDSQPEIAEAHRAALEEYGDWAEYVFGKGTTWYTGREDNETHLLFSPLTFTLADKEGEISKGASFFYHRDDNGEESGFVVDVLGLTFPEATPIGDIVQGCINAEFYSAIGYEPDQNDPKRENRVFSEPTSV